MLRKLLLECGLLTVAVQALRLHSESFAEGGEKSELDGQESAAKAKPWQALMALLLAYNPSPSNAFVVGPSAPHAGLSHGLSGGVSQGPAFNRNVGRRIRQQVMAASGNRDDNVDVLGIRFAEDSKLHPDLPFDWKSTSVNLVFFDEDEYAQTSTPSKLVKNLDNIIEDWEKFAMKKSKLSGDAIIRGLGRPSEINDAAASMMKDYNSETASTLQKMMQSLEARRKLEMEDALRSLQRMRKDINAQGPLHVFGLAFREPSTHPQTSSIQAMATVQLLTAYDGTHDHSQIDHGIHDQGMIGVVHIKDIVSAPYTIDAGYVGTKGEDIGKGSELFSQIIDWAKQQGKLVTVTPANNETERTCRGLGFEFITTADDGLMVYIGDRDGYPPTTGSTHPLADIVKYSSREESRLLEFAGSKGILVDLVMEP